MNHLSSYADLDRVVGYLQLQGFHYIPYRRPILIGPDPAQGYFPYRTGPVVAVSRNQKWDSRDINRLLRDLGVDPARFWMEIHSTRVG